MEIQAGRRLKAFTQRMFTYHIRLREQYPGQHVVSLAVLTDRADSAQRLSYTDGYWGCALTFDFPVVHLEAWRARIPELMALAPDNPFAVVILAQLQANATRDGTQRLARKTELLRHLKHWGYGRDNIVQLFRIIDAMVSLPAELEPAFEQAVNQLEEETQMTYVTSVERVRLRREREEGKQEGIEKGRQQGREEGREAGQLDGATALLATQIARKFGTLPDWARVRMNQADEAALNRWALQILDARRIEDVFA